MKIRLTAAAKQINKTVVVTNMMLRPTTIKVFLPAFSIKTNEIKVIATFMEPIPNVADCASDSFNPADVKIDVEKNIAALIPDNC